jgi:hypothetical protein
MRIGLISILLYLITVQALNAQTELEYFYGDPHFITQCEQVKQISTDEFIFFLTKSYINPAHYHDSLILGAETYVVLYHSAKQELERFYTFDDLQKGEYPGYSPEVSGAIVVPIIIETQIGAEREVQLFKADLTLTSYSLVSLDFTDLQQQFPLEFIQTSLSVVDDSSNIFMSGYLGNYIADQLSFIAKFDSQGSLLAWDTLGNFPNRSLFLLENKRPVLYSKKMGQFAFYYNDLSRDTLVTEVGIALPFVGFNDAIDNQFRCLNIGDKLLFSGEQQFFINPQLDKKTTEMLSFMNTRTLTVDSILTIEVPQNIDDVISFGLSVDTIGPYIYFSNALQNSESYIFYGNYDNFPECTSYVSLHKADTNGNLHWSKYYGGDACYFPSIVESTIDSGVILVVDRYDPEVDASENQYYIKLDKDGNQEENFFPNMDSLLMSNGIAAPSDGSGFSIYPNPFGDLLFVEISDFKGQEEYVLIDALGRLVYTDDLTNPRTQIDLSHLDSGVYFIGVESSWKRIVKQ